MIKCSNCDGIGFYHGPLGTYPCPSCGGSGKIKESMEELKLGTFNECLACKGEGYFGDPTLGEFQCKICNGTGRVEKSPEELKLADRFNEGKVQWSLVDFKSLEPMVKVLEYGAKKYARENWKKGLPTLEICESLLRHTFAFMSGEDNDPESGLPHIGHMQCNLMFLAYVVREMKQLDTRSNKPVERQGDTI